MGAASRHTIQGIDLTGNRYTVEQALIRNKYEAYDANGNTILKTKQKLLKMKEEFPFTDANGNEVFTVKAGGLIDIAGDYTLTDAATGEELVVLDNDYSILKDTWKIRDAQTEEKLAEINSRGAVVTLARHYVPFGTIIPHKYEITDQRGNHVGNIDGQFTIKDRYEVVIDDASTVPKEPIVAAAMVIDAIQGN